jgi:hypothetical protein
MEMFVPFLAGFIAGNIFCVLLLASLFYFWLLRRIAKNRAITKRVHGTSTTVAGTATTVEGDDDDDDDEDVPVTSVSTTNSSAVTRTSSTTTEMRDSATSQRPSSTAPSLASSQTIDNGNKKDGTSSTCEYMQIER